MASLDVGFDQSEDKLWVGDLTGDGQAEIGLAPDGQPGSYGFREPSPRERGPRQLLGRRAVHEHGRVGDHVVHAGPRR